MGVTWPTVKTILFNKSSTKTCVAHTNKVVHLRIKRQHGVYEYGNALLTQFEDAPIEIPFPRTLMGQTSATTTHDTGPLLSEKSFRLISSEIYRVVLKTHQL